jgi:ParB-like chromosome segregation protein Spo0J
VSAFLSIFDHMRATNDPTRYDLVAEAAAAFEALGTIEDLDERVATINAIREELTRWSPFQDEPVDFVRWVPVAEVEANDYNPNAVAPPEMELLRISIMADGYTQPIVTNDEDGTRVVIDGFHRNRVGRECEDVAARIQGYLPVVQIRSDRVDRGDRIAATIRHNRARGKHQVDRMADIVLELKRRNWSDEKIGRELGMDPDEVLRLAQITGLADAFLNRDFSEAWEAVIDPSESDDLDDATLE